MIGLTTTKTIELVLDQSAGLYVTDAMYVFAPKSEIDPKVLMAVMQSKLFHFLYTVANMGESRVIPQIKATKLLTLPIPNLTRCDELAQPADRMLDLHRHLATAKSEHRRPLSNVRLMRPTRKLTGWSTTFTA